MGGYWVNLAKLRILALHAPDSMGMSWFQDLIVTRYHRACDPDDTCSTAYSYGLRMSLHLQGDRELRSPGSTGRCASSSRTTILGFPVMPIHESAAIVAVWHDVIGE